MVPAASAEIPALLPKLTQTPGATNWPGPELGSHNTEILQQLLGLDDRQIAELESARVIANSGPTAT